MASGDYFFTLPSDVGRRRSMIDPLGFRGTIGHFMLRICPGFTGRVRGRTWFPILAWAAKEVEERQVRDAQYGDDWEQARVRVGKRREHIVYLERALRLGAALQENGIRDGSRWRYGNLVRWWQQNRESSTRHFDLTKPPPFFSSRAGELANGALGSLRRSLERLGFFTASEKRLIGGTLDVSASDRFRVTSRGQELAEAYEQDLRAQNVSLTLLQEWGLWPTGNDVRRNEQLRRENLVKLAGALPVTKAGTFDRTRFPRTARRLDASLKVDKDPLFADGEVRGPFAATVAALLRDDTLHPAEALAALPRTDFWSRRLGAALDCAHTLMGPSNPDPPLFEILAAVFVDGMKRAFPDGALDCQAFDRDHGTFAPDTLDAAFVRRRAEYRERWEALFAIEADPLMDLCPLVERRAGSGVTYFNQWLETTERLTLERLLELHVDLPRFATGRVMPLVERDAGGAFLDSIFPWGSFGTAFGQRTSDEIAEPVEDDDAELLADDEEEPDTIEGNRELATNYWTTPHIAAQVIRGTGA